MLKKIKLSHHYHHRLETVRTSKFFWLVHIRSAPQELMKLCKEQEQREKQSCNLISLRPKAASRCIKLELIFGQLLADGAEVGKVASGLVKTNNLSKELIYSFFLLVLWWRWRKSSQVLFQRVFLVNIKCWLDTAMWFLQKGNILSRLVIKSLRSWRNWIHELLKQKET